MTGKLSTFERRIEILFFIISSKIDINDISVDKDLPKPERIKEYIRQIKNPYCFKCGNFVVKARYQNAGLSIEDCLQSIII